MCVCVVHACSVMPTLCNPMNWSPSGSSVMGFSKNTGVGCHFLLQGIVSTNLQRIDANGSNTCILLFLPWQGDSLPLEPPAKALFISSTVSLPVTQTVKNPPITQETQVQLLEGEDSLEKGMAAHSSVLAWRITTARRAWWAVVHRVSDSRT